MRGFAIIAVVLLSASVLSGCVDDDVDPGDDNEEPVPSEHDGEENRTAALGYLEPRIVEGGSTFEDATGLDPVGLYASNLTGGEHYYKFHVEVGASVNIELRGVLWQGTFPAVDNERRPSFRLLSPEGVLLETPNTNQGDTRLVLTAAPATGEYRFLVTEEIGGFTGPYTFCFLLEPPAEHPCPDIGIRSQGNGAYDKAHTTVLLVPPMHGDLGNPFGPTALDYLEAAVSGIHEWVDALHAFAEDYPEFDYLKEVTVSIQIFDGAQDTAEYDILIAYIETAGSQFRGVATGCLVFVGGPQCIVLTLLANSPRAGQLVPDYPEYDDMEALTMHEFAHTWYLGHTLTWTEEYGPDLMNSPAPFVYGDGDPVGDGGVRSGKQCLSSLNLFGAARVFNSLSDNPMAADNRTGSYHLPDDMPYEWYCGDEDERGFDRFDNPNVEIRGLDAVVARYEGEQPLVPPGPEVVPYVQHSNRNH